jgi:hypothetical protein
VSPWVIGIVWVVTCVLAVWVFVKVEWAVNEWLHKRNKDRE